MASSLTPAENVLLEKWERTFLEKEMIDLTAVKNQFAGNYSEPLNVIKHMYLKSHIDRVGFIEEDSNHSLPLYIKRTQKLKAYLKAKYYK